MKVQEKHSDRRCHVHTYALGESKPLDEYGEYVDPDDGAICCFVPVEEHQKIKVEGKFAGTTMTIQCDVLVDGICRKANIYSSKVTSTHKSKTIGFDKVLFRSSDGIIESNLTVKPIDKSVKIKQTAPTTLGTVEFRVSVLRNVGEKHALRDVPLYSEREGEGHNVEEPVGFKTVQPEFTMTYEEDCPTLETRKAKAELRKIKSARPGNEDWAVFRFHYRKADTIEEFELERTFDSNSPKTKTPAHELNIKELHVDEVGSNGKDEDEDGDGDGEGTSTRASSPVPSAAASQTASNSTFKTATPATNTERNSHSSTPRIAAMTPEDLAQLQHFNESSPKPLSMTPPATPVTATDTSKPAMVVESVEALKEVTTHHKKAAKPVAQGTPQATTETQKPAATVSGSQLAPITPVKRAAELIQPPCPNAKRIKNISTSIPTPPVFKYRQISVPQSPSLSPTSDGMSSHLATMRAKLANAQKKKAAFKEKQKRIEEELAPYQAKMAEEMAQIKKQLEMEEAEVGEAEKTFKASVQMLDEFKNGRADL